MGKQVSFSTEKRRYRIRIAGRKCCPYPQSPTLKTHTQCLHHLYMRFAVRKQGLASTSILNVATSLVALINARLSDFHAFYGTYGQTVKTDRNLNRQKNKITSKILGIYLIHNVSSSGELVGKLCICILYHNCHKQTLLCLHCLALHCLGLSLEPICLEQSLGDSLRLSFENFPPGLKTLRGKIDNCRYAFWFNFRERKSGLTKVWIL